MRKNPEVPALDGIPGIMPGTVQAPPPPKFYEDEIESAKPQNHEIHHLRNLDNIPRHHRRMMPCNRVERKNGSK